MYVEIDRREAVYLNVKAYVKVYVKASLSPIPTNATR